MSRLKRGGLVAALALGLSGSPIAVGAQSSTGLRAGSGYQRRASGGGKRQHRDGDRIEAAHAKRIRRQARNLARQRKEHARADERSQRRARIQNRKT
jgi:hypothetical protein